MAGWSWGSVEHPGKCKSQATQLYGVLGIDKRAHHRERVETSAAHRHES
jgi:hypothetical protein